METPNVWGVFRDGLTVTGIGMALVFLTLIIVALVIWGLDKLFKAKPKADDGDGDDDDDAGFVTAVVETEDAAENTLADQVAAIAVALNLQSRQASPALAMAPAGVARAAMAALPWQPVADVDDEEITGEVITVSGIAGSASWKARGRLDGLK